jgi:hypothetical protein
MFAEGDRRVSWGTPAALARSESVRVYADVPKTNYMHLPMTSANDRRSARLMKGLGQRDVQHIIAPIVKPGCSSKGASDGDEARPSG